MPSSPLTHRQPRYDQTPQKGPTPAESADYTYDMLISLRKLAVFHKQAKLARHIETAAMEARSIADRNMVNAGQKPKD
jgi:hypothetical protein